jgi:hypothetical protein
VALSAGNRPNMDLHCTAGKARANAAGRALPSGAQANSAVQVLAKAALADQVLANGAGSVRGTAG